MGMFADPYVWPCRKAAAETARGIRAGLRGDQDPAQAHYDQADQALAGAVRLGTNKKC